MGIKKKTKSYPATRKFVLRRDASVASGIKEIERVFGLPEGSVRLVRPGSNRAARGDKTVDALLKDWGC